MGSAEREEEWKARSVITKARSMAANLGGCFANTPIQFDGLIHVDIQEIDIQATSGCTSALACFLRVEQPWFHWRYCWFWVKAGIRGHLWRPTGIGPIPNTAHVES